MLLLPDGPVRTNRLPCFVMKQKPASALSFGVGRAAQLNQAVRHRSRHEFVGHVLRRGPEIKGRRLTVQAPFTRLVEFFEDGRTELYALERDPGESRDLSSGNPGKAAELLERMRSWRRSTGAPVPTERNPEYEGD